MREPLDASVGGAVGAAEMLMLLLDGKPRTKSELAAMTGVSRVTVAARVDALLRSDLLRYVGTESSSGGRPPAQVAFNRDAGLVLAIDLGATRTTIAVTNLAAEIKHIRTTPIDVAAGPETVLDAVFEIARDLLESFPRERLLGIGIGLPGAIEHASGRPINPPIMPGWDRFEVPAYVQRTFPVPVLVDNDVNILALGEHELSWPETDDLIFVKVATGIGAGIISGGRLQRGSQGIAGDIGHIWVPYNKDSGWSFEEEHTLGTTASGRGILTELRARGRDVSSIEDVAQLLTSGDLEVAEVVRGAGREIGEVLSMMVNALNPRIVVVGGSIARAGEHLMAGIRETVYRRSIPLATQDLQVVQSQGGERAGVLGASILVIRELLSPVGIEKRIQRNGDAKTESAG